MRIHRISLRNFRGVEEVDVEFDADGVTVVVGPNEVGKTSLADALTFLLDYKDSAARAGIRDAQPIGRDVGPFVEAELTVGRHRFRYCKQWLKGHKTELEVIEPQLEQLAGEAAHDRVARMLEEEADMGLFRALRYQQGLAITQASVGSATSLAAALDAAAGGNANAAAQDGLLDRARVEFRRYFTEKGAIPATRKNRLEELEQRRVRASDIGQQLASLEQAAERQQRLEDDLQLLREQLPEAEDRVNQQTQTVAEIEQTERRVAELRHESELAAATLREAHVGQQERERLASARVEAAADREKLTQEAGDAASSLQEAQTAEATAASALSDADSQVQASEEEAARCSKVVELIERRIERDQLRERDQRVRAADEAITHAERFIASCAVDDALLQRIETATADLAVARGKVDGGRPHVRVEAIQPVRVELDGQANDAVPGTPIATAVTSELDIVIGDVARVVVSPAAGRVDDAQDALALAQNKFDGLMRTAEVPSLEAARETVAVRVRQEIELTHARGRRDEALRDLEPAELAGKLERAEVRVTALEDELDPVELDDRALEDMRGRAEQANAGLRAAKAVAEERQTAVAAAVRAREEFDRVRTVRQTQLESAVATEDRVRKELEAARIVKADADVADAVGQAEGAATAAAAALSIAEADLAAGDPAASRTMLDAERALVERLQQDIRANELERAATRAKLELGGHDGLADRLAEAEAQVVDIERELDAEQRRADAARLLYEVLVEKRDQAQQVYIQPFREKLNAYARILYGASASLTVDHSSFEITSRTAGGKVVPFDSLSGGAREQLSVLARLACGALVAPDDGAFGGVPVIIDDALGYSDQERLKKLWAALAVAGRDCQVIVLTCEAARYRGVGNATVVALA